MPGSLLCWAQGTRTISGIKMISTELPQARMSTCFEEAKRAAVSVLAEQAWHLLSPNEITDSHEPKRLGIFQMRPQTLG